ncbi:hypothetical protein ACFVVQ_14950 [Paenibacillus chitinolyticus]|uniref:hypothetical protein n=1 Tax=Paenibacillus chitinolyticus TaxID=79263 RepID=UPI0036D889B3
MIWGLLILFICFTLSMEFSILKSLLKELKQPLIGNMDTKFSTLLRTDEARFNELVDYFSSYSENEVFKQIKFYESKKLEPTQDKISDSIQKAIFPLVSLVITIVVSYTTIMVSLSKDKADIRVLTDMINEIYNNTIINLMLSILGSFVLGVLSTALMDVWFTKTKISLIAFRIKSLEVSLEIIKKQNFDKQKIQELYLSLMKKLH